MVSLFSPLRIAGLELPNRIAVSPMCQYSSEDGFANDWHLIHLGSRATGGAGLVFTEAAAVSPEGRITPADLGIWKDEHIGKLSQIAEFVHARGSKFGIQLAHAGRKASMSVPWVPERVLPREEGGWTNVLAPSAVPFSAKYPQPLELSHGEIARIAQDFAAAAKRASQIGADVIELHSAHGYLLHEFLSPLSNHRGDEYGGEFANRIRLLLEVVRAVRSEWADSKPLFVRISSTDWTEGGWTADDSVRLAGILKQNGVHLIDCSSGGNVPGAKIPAGPGNQVSFAERIRAEADILTGAVGMITEAEQAQEIIQAGKADLVLLAREMLRDPYWPLRAAKKLGAGIAWPVQYQRAAN